MVLGLTQRVQFVEAYGERRDCLDQQWYRVAAALNLLPVSLPNIAPERVALMCNELALSGLVLTGGNTLAACDPEDPTVAPERDACESALLEWAIERELPVVGVCRGLQMLNHFFGGHAVRIDGHAGTRHVVRFEGRLASEPNREVNSFHDWAIDSSGLAKELQPLARHEDGSIEAFEHERLPITALMWHPEREAPFSELDLQLVNERLR
jgi:gamma-glutamyl-gamma-aminobutyrate hydrolase PuuD